ncbi:hypothetical protein HX848_06920 [Marine Group I thaumarchaeote]|uniref:Uncharacterized protein n=1 Tax=Marine Group I thaumarchaeote TaxID=2511932 RepID=A0A7K4MIS2_9ARCH|nr:hypothetical protein [Marine Group I thaumarchaeote]
MEKYGEEHILKVLKEGIGNRSMLKSMLESIRMGKSLSSYETKYMNIIVNSGSHTDYFTGDSENIKENEILKSKIEIQKAGVQIKLEQIRKRDLQVDQRQKEITLKVLSQQKDISQLQNEMKSTEMEIKSTEMEITSHEKVFAEKEKLSNQQQETIKKLHSENNNTNSKLNKISQNVVELKNETILQTIKRNAVIEVEKIKSKLEKQKVIQVRQKQDTVKTEVSKTELSIIQIQNEIKIKNSEITSYEKVLIQQEILSDLKENEKNLNIQLHQKYKKLDSIKSNHIIEEKNDEVSSKIKLKKKQIDKLLFEQKEILDAIKQISKETKFQENENNKLNKQVLELNQEQINLEEKISHMQKQKETQEKELADLHTERLEFISKNKQNQEMVQQIQKYQTRLEKISDDRRLFESEIKNQTRLLEDEQQKEKNIMADIISVQTKLKD